MSWPCLVVALVVGLLGRMPLARHLWPSGGARRGRVARFLTSFLQPATQQRYHQAIADYRMELATRGIDFYSLNEDECDWLLAERVVDIYEETEGETHWSKAAVLVSAVAKVNPRFHLRCAFKALDVWRQRHPPNQAAAFSSE